MKNNDKKDYICTDGICRPRNLNEKLPAGKRSAVRKEKNGKSRSRTLIWLPGPLGDAVMSTPALTAARKLYADDEIFFLASPVVKSILEPTACCDGWIVPRGKNPVAIASKLRGYRFDRVILLKNSFSCAMAVFLAGIKVRAGYARDRRSWLLNHKIAPAKDEHGRYLPRPMIDYYLDLMFSLGADKECDRRMHLDCRDEDLATVKEKLGRLFEAGKPIIILVPGGAFGPSKCWMPQRFAAVADSLIERYDANVVVSVAPNKAELEIAEAICDNAKHPLTNLGKCPVSLAQLKALFSRAALVITNDTGPRHIAIALARPVVTMFGPNDPAWTLSHWKKEIQIIGDVPCAPCAKPVCKADDHYCMKSITTETVLAAAEKLLGETLEQH